MVYIRLPLERGQRQGGELGRKRCDVTRPGYSDRATLRAWADRRESEGEFPRLIRRLILETTFGLVELGVPAGDGVSTGGWDGVVSSTEGSAWVPKGRSLWELSTEKSVGVKADRDYDKRAAVSGCGAAFRA